VNGKLDDRCAFVTGAGSGLGAEIARAFAREGARVMVTDINLDSARAVADECSAIRAGSEATFCDVADSSSVAEAFRRMDESLGRIDLLVNNAGIIHTDPAFVEKFQATGAAQMAEAMAGGPITSHWTVIESLSDEMFDRMLKVHLYGTFYCTREALRRMRERGAGGRIINMGSIMGTTSLAGAPDYCAAKGAILAFTRATAREGASYGVLANAIAPGFIDTPLLDPFDEQARALLCLQTPLGRFGEPSDVAAVAVYLAGPDSKFVTGQTISPNGGIYMSQ